MTDKHYDSSTLLRQIEKAEQELIEKRIHRGDEEDGIAVLFTGNWHAAFPHQLVLDQTLSPVEKITWQALRLSITDPSRPGATPRRDDLASMINCSGPTVTSSRTMLRICRWMTFCKSVRKQGRFVGDIYLFNDEPMSLASTLVFDSYYITFLQQQAQSASKRLRTVAAATLREIDTLRDIEQPTELDKISARMGSLLFAQPPIATQHHRSKIFAAADKDKKDTKSTLNIDKSAITGVQGDKFAADDANKREELTHQSKFFAAVESDQSKFFTGTKNFFPRARGSNNNYINNKYITAREENSESVQNTDSESSEPFSRFENFNQYCDPEKTFALAIQAFPQLASFGVKRYVIATFWPNKENQIPIIQRIISKVPEPTRSYVLLQLIGRHAKDMHGWSDKLLHNAISYTRVMVDKALKNDFFPDEWALALETAIANDDDTYFPDSPEMMRRKRLVNGENIDTG